MGEDYNHPTDNIDYLLDKIIEVIPAPKQLEGTPQLLITSLDYSSYTGRIERCDKELRSTLELLRSSRVLLSSLSHLSITALIQVVSP